jgi:hypothetical protein
MEYLLKAQWLWTLVLGVGLYFPVRKLIWVMSVRRAERKHGPTDEEKREFLRKRAYVTAALLCFIFSVLYTNTLFQTPQP